MGKRKSKNEQRQAGEQSENPPEQNNEENNAENSNEENKNTQNPKGVIVLGVYMHCQGCANKVVKCLRGFDGVEEIEIDVKNHKVTVKGKNADPTKVAERLRKKTHKHVELISPIPKGKKEEKKEAKKEEPKVVEVLLKIYMHCENCEREIKHCIHKMKGVQTVETDMGKSQVTVRGVFDTKKLVEYISKRAGKLAVILKQTPEKKEDGTGKKEGDKGEKKEGDKGEKKEGEKENKKDLYHNYPLELVYAPQFFSDENPNSCSVM